MFMYMRNMLTETSSKHFSERLYYADYPAEGVTPLTIICTFALILCLNGSCFRCMQHQQS